MTQFEISKNAVPKIIIYMALFIISLQLSSELTLITSNSGEVPSFYLFSGIVLALSVLYGIKYTILIFPSFILYSILQMGDFSSVSITTMVLAIVFTVAYYIGSLYLKKMKIGEGLFKINDLVSLIVVSLFLPFLIFVFALFIILTDGSMIELIGSILKFWIRDLIGILSIVPIIFLIYDRIDLDSIENKISIKSINEIRKQVFNFINYHKEPILVVLLTIITNYISLLINRYYNIEMFYLTYLPTFWLAAQDYLEGVNINVFLINVIFFANRKSVTLLEEELLILVLVFTIASQIFAVIIRERDEKLQYANNKLYDLNKKLKSTNDKLKQTNDNLERSNKELEQFAYVASHDLQEPLRAIIGYLQLFDKKYGNYPDEKANKYISMVIESSEQMQTMINDLLAFSRVGTRNQQFAKVNLNEVVTDTRNLLSTKIENSQTSITVDKLPYIYGNQTQLTLLFQNLIMNAIKYCEKKPEIKITSSCKNGFAKISVEDNGIGMSPEYFDRIFIIFKRLHGRHEYDGSGIGLAISKKIVERHGGEIWVESEINNGSTFYFTLPLLGDR